MLVALDLLERMKLCRSRQTGQPVPYIAANADRASELGIQVANGDILGEIVQASEDGPNCADGVFFIGR